MHEDVQPDIFLPAYCAGRLVLQVQSIGFVRQGAPGVSGTCVANVGRLRKRADRRGREGRQVETLVLNADALREHAGAATHRIVDAGDAGRYFHIVNPWRSLARGGYLVRGVQPGCGRSAAAGERRSEGCQFLDLLH